MPVVDPFAEARLGPVTLRNRIIKAATFEGVMPEALVTPELIEYHRAVAAGGAGMSTVAYLAVAPEGRTHAECIWLRPEAVPGLRRLTDAIHDEGAAAGAQIGHAGPVANSRSNKAASLAPSKRFNPLAMRVIRAATGADIARITNDYARAARLAAAMPASTPSRSTSATTTCSAPSSAPTSTSAPTPGAAPSTTGPGSVARPSRRCGPRWATSWPSPPRST